MRGHAPAAVAFFLLLLPLASPRAQEAQDPSEDFLKAYMLCQKAQQLEEEEKFADALARYTAASALIVDIASKHPNWQPLIVEYRAKRTAEKIEQLKAKVPPGQVAQIPPEELPPDPSQPAKPATPPPGSTPQPKPDPQAAATQPPAMGAPPIPTPATETPKAEPDPERGEALQIQLRDLEARLAKSEQERADLARQLEERSAQFRDTARELDGLKKAESDLKTRLAEAQSELKDLTGKGKSPDQPLLKKIETLEADLVAVRSERDTAVKLAREVSTKLDRANTERDQAIAQMAPLKETERKYNEIVADHARISKNLEDAGRATAALAEREAEIAKLKQEIERLKGDIAIAQKQGADAQKLADQLQEQLDSSSAELARYKMAGASPDEIRKMEEENSLLRSILSRQFKGQARREQAKRLVLEELARLEIKSDDLQQHLNYLAQPIVEVPDEEKKKLLGLLKDPDANLADANSDLSITLEAARAPGAGPGAGDLPSGPATPKTPGGPVVETAFKPAVPPDMVNAARRAKEFFDQGKYRDAERIYDMVLSKEPTNLYALSNLGVVYYRTGRLKAAEMMLKKAIEVDPKDVFSQQTLGIVYYKQARYDDAMEALTKSLDLNPNNAIAHNYLGITASRKGWPEAAQKEIMEAIALNPDYADAHFNLAVLYATGDPPSVELARRHYSRATSLGADPDPILERMLH